MTRVSEFLDDIEQTLQQRGIRSPGRFVLLDHAKNELQELQAKAPWDWGLTHLDPAIATQTGLQSYALPENFAENFERYGGEKGDDYCCKLDDGSNENVLPYVSPVAFFSQNIRAASNGRPTKYTVMTSGNGGRELLLYPKPDANGSTGYYTVDGLYRPVWNLAEQAQMQVVPGNSPIIKYAVLRRIDPKNYQSQYVEALSYLMFNAAQQRQGQLVPAIGKSSWNPNTMMHWRRR